jgi:hypothetical protein
LTSRNSYDYIRSINLPAIRQLKNISIFAATALLVISLMALASSTQKERIVTPASATVSQKAKTEQNKKNSFLRRFVSYYRVPVLTY